MKVWELTKMLTPETVCKIMDRNTGRHMMTDTAGSITEKRISDHIKDWDFSEEHIILI